MMVESRYARKRRRILNSVFTTEITQPTPSSTPALGDAHPGHVFGILPPKPPVSVDLFSSTSPARTTPSRKQTRFAQLSSPQHGHYGQHAMDEQVQWDRAWHAVTSAIALPPSVAVEDSFGSERSLNEDPEFAAALADILYASSRLPHATHTDDLLHWHTQQVRKHFVTHVLPHVTASAAALPHSDSDSADLPDIPGVDSSPSLAQHARILVSSVRTLEAADRMYRFGITHIVKGFQSPDDAQTALSRFQQDLHAVVSSSILGSDPAAPLLVAAIRTVVSRLAAVVLEVPGPAAQLSIEESMVLGLSPPSRRGVSVHQKTGDAATASARAELHHLVEILRRVGLVGERFQVLFAEIMDAAMEDFINRSYAGKWGGSPFPSSPFGMSTKRSRWGGSQKHSSLGVSITSGGAGASKCMTDLSDWVENCFARLAEEVTTRIQPTEASEGLHSPSNRELVWWSTIEKWKELALGRLATLRINELFDIVLSWPRSKAALDDLRNAASVSAGPTASSFAPPGAQQQKRLQLTDTFELALQKRLLHPGRSTLQILRVYIAMIRTFHALDHSKVLLDRVVQRLQVYLCQREDAVRIVVSGLLVTPEEAASELDRYRERETDPKYVSKARLIDIRDGPDQLVELSAILTDPAQQRRLPAEDEALDWNDMDWIPDPIDAGQNYRRPKSEDVIGTLISALGSQDIFIREFQSIVAERLLAMGGWNVGQEIRVLKLLKKRFGEQELQATDVMLRDIHESIKLDAFISKVMYPEFMNALPTPGSNPSEHIPLHTKILSRLFWPNLSRDNSFLVPPTVEDWMRCYESKYEKMKHNRKLNWLHALGTAEVEVELEDRTLRIQVKTYEATVIAVFAEDVAVAAQGQGGRRVRKTAEQIEDELQMPEGLVKSALRFWTENEVLYHNEERNYYWVRERLTDKEEASVSSGEDGTGSRQTSPEKAKATSSAGRMAQEYDPQKTVYWQFIVGMLTNSSTSMPLAQIAMMMKLMIVDGFAWTEEQLQEFLAEKVEEGLLELAGGKYKLGKK
ncbi:anaphase-promoting complex subunit (Cullin family protein) [Zalerion maritima]|uniref:Anaphase-promoting complex subunit 2 n=1 Tax=Zalerion maritima TaxID=339359 RepID=A0AAD5RHH6_9PEZI|nr:anaphase-promoting complex subunit (Cullin family protein) [Zalerion maritima]